MMLRFLNNNGFPAIESISIASNGTGTTTITFKNHSFVNAKFAGGFYVKLSLTLATGSDVVQFATDNVPNSTLPLYLSTGALATTADLVSEGNSIHLCFYDRDSNRLQLIA